MKRIIILAPYFTPSNQVGVLRPRLLASNLREFGWEPTVVCVDPLDYEEPSDEASLALLPEGLRVERVRAWPSAICRPLGFGDVSLRAQWALRRKVKELVHRERFDLVFATVLPGYTSLVGAWTKRNFGLQFVLDYQDPWVSDWGAQQPRWSKAGLSHWLALKLEPGVMPIPDALTAVSNQTLDTLRERKLLGPRMPVEIIPIGADEQDYVVAARVGRSQISKEPGMIDLAYVGTLTQRMLPALRTLLLATKDVNLRLKEYSGPRSKSPAPQIRVHLIGTSAQANGTDTLGVGRMIRDLDATEFVRLEPRRLPYLDALRTMQAAEGLLLLGSTDSHYTASKIFPYWLAKRPVLGIFHAASSVNRLARDLGGITLVTYDGANGPESCVSEVTSVLRKMISESAAIMMSRNVAGFNQYSAHGVAKKYAALFDQLVHPFGSSRKPDFELPICESQMELAR